MPKVILEAILEVFVDIFADVFARCFCQMFLLDVFQDYEWDVLVHPYFFVLMVVLQG